MEIGDHTPDNLGYYAKIQGQPYLFTVNKDWYAAMIDLLLNPPDTSNTIPP